PVLVVLRAADLRDSGRPVVRFRLGSAQIRHLQPDLFLLPIWYYQSRSSVKRFLGASQRQKTAIWRAFLRLYSLSVSFSFPKENSRHIRQDFFRDSTKTGLTRLTLVKLLPDYAPPASPPA